MPDIRFTAALSDEFATLFASCEIQPGTFDQVDGIVDRILADRSRYEAVQRKLGVPWFFVAVIHNMESSGRFDRHLHNGDPLTERTRQIPAGRPLDGEPPFTWEASATDALTMKRLNQIDEWPLPRILYEIERYNGWGYRRFHPDVLTPYLWSFSNHYKSGKYIADGTWSNTAVSRQCGAAVLIRRLEQRGEVVLSARSRRKVFFKYSPRSVKDRAADLQRFFNTFPGVSLRVDGLAGQKTSDVARQLFGHYLSGDPRGDE